MIWTMASPAGSQRRITLRIISRPVVARASSSAGNLIPSRSTKRDTSSVFCAVVSLRTYNGNGYFFRDHEQILFCDYHILYHPVRLWFNKVNKTQPNIHPTPIQFGGIVVNQNKDIFLKYLVEVFHDFNCKKIICEHCIVVTSYAKSLATRLLVQLFRVNDK